MLWNEHSDLSGKHALLGASNFYWINYDDESLERKFKASYSQVIGTSLHALAKSLIDHKIRLNKNDKHLVLLHLLNDGIPRGLIDMERFFPNLMLYVNDSIGFRMKAEQVLYFTDNCFGTTDAISFREGCLRIHDLKTGETPAHMEQLYIYAALFCLEYNQKPTEIETELCIYQGGEVINEKADPAVVIDIIQKMKDSDKKIRRLKHFTEG